MVSVTFLTWDVGHKRPEFSPNALTSRPGSLWFTLCQGTTQRVQAEVQGRPQGTLAPGSAASGSLKGRAWAQESAPLPLRTQTVSNIWYPSFPVAEHGAQWVFREFVE